MSLLNLIKVDETSKYISLKEVINLLAEKTESNIFEVAVYLLNQNTESSIDCYVRGIDYKLHISSSARYDCQGWVGDNMAFVCLQRIAENKSVFGIPQRIVEHSTYSKKCEEAFWKRTDFFNLECIKTLNLFTPEEFSSDRQQQYIWDKSYLSIQQSDVPTQIEYADLRLNEIDMPLDFDDDNPIEEIPLFYLNDTVTILEAACMLSGDDLFLIKRCLNDTNFDQNYPRFNEAYNFINSAIYAESLPEEPIPSDQLKKYLAEKGKIIKGFNKPVKSASNDLVDAATVGQALQEHYLKHSDELLKENEYLNILLKEKNIELARLRESQSIHQQDLINQLYDYSAIERYAPDLVHAIKLWEHLYINNPKGDSHSNMSNQWLANNTGYDLTQVGGKPSMERIREIATPLTDWGHKRNKNYKKLI